MRKIFFSLSSMVLIMNRLSNEKNMKLPLLPFDSLALNSYCAFASVERDSSIMAEVMLSIFLIALKIDGANSVIFTSSLIVRMLYVSSGDESVVSARLRAYLLSDILLSC